MDKFIVNIDGGSRGNPGPAAVGIVIADSRGRVLHRIGEAIGETTNNEAEYRAAITALKKIKGLWGKQQARQASVEFRADSQLVVRQMRGQYKIEHPNIQKLFLELWNLMVEFGEVRFVSIPREENAEADALVNEALDVAGKPGRLFS